MLEDLKSKPVLSRQDIEDLLASIGAPGENREEKIASIKELGKSNFQGIGMENSLGDYGNW